MKKLILIVLTLLCSLMTVKAEELPTITVGSYRAYKGEEITISVSIENNVGFSVIGFKVSYDKDSLEYINGELLNVERFTMKDVVENKDNSKIVMYALTIKDDVSMDKDDAVLKMRFKVKDDAKDNTLKIDVTDFGNRDNSKIKYKAVDGEIKILNKGYVNETGTFDSENNNNDEKEQENVSWKSSDEKVATVDENGNITFKNNGEVTITKTDEDGNAIDSKEYKVVDKDETKIDEASNKSMIIPVVIGIVVVLIAIIGFIIKRKPKQKQ